MRHRKYNIKFGRKTGHYKATLRQLASSLILKKSISTTKTKAKELSSFAEKLVTIGKKNCVANQRKAYSVLRDRDMVSILFNDIAPLFKDRNGGYTRVMLTGMRRGDNAQMAIVEFVEKPAVQKKKEEKKAQKLQPRLKVDKKEKPEAPKPKKEEIVKKEEEAKKPIQPPAGPIKPEEPKPKPGFFKKLFGRKKKDI